MHHSYTFCKVQCPRDKGKSPGMPLRGKNRGKNCKDCFIYDKMITVFLFWEMRYESAETTLLDPITNTNNNDKTS